MPTAAKRRIFFDTRLHKIAKNHRCITHAKSLALLIANLPFRGQRTRPLFWGAVLAHSSRLLRFGLVCGFSGLKWSVEGGVPPPPPPLPLPRFQRRADKKTVPCGGAYFGGGEGRVATMGCGVCSPLLKKNDKSTAIYDGLIKSS